MKNDRVHDLEQIRQTYGRYAREGRSRLWDVSNPGYARMMRDRDAALVTLLREALAEARGRVLDLGCGDGRLADLARAAGLQSRGWTGVDVDAASIATASTAWPWARFVEASADQLPFGDASFDVIVATTLFSSLPSRAMEGAVASEIRRVLSRNGTLLWYDLRYDNPGNAAVHGLSVSRVSELFPGWLVDLRPLTLLPPLSRRLGRATPVLYPALHALRILRSHLIGRVRPSG